MLKYYLGIIGVNMETTIFWIGMYLVIGMFLADTIMFNNDELFWWLVFLFYPIILVIFFVLWLFIQTLILGLRLKEWLVY